MRTHSQSKKNGVSVSDTEDDSVDLNDFSEKENSLIAETHLLPLFSQDNTYFAFNAAQSHD